MSISQGIWQNPLRWSKLRCIKYEDLAVSDSGKGLLVDLDDFAKWIIFEDENLLVINKPGWLVCHPSKNGPLSSLIGASRVYAGLDVMHIVNRLDRETSGVVLIAKNKPLGSTLQKAMEYKQIKKTYLTILEGRLDYDILVDRSMRKAPHGKVFIKQQVLAEGIVAKKCLTKFEPRYWSHKFTVCTVYPYTGKTHQIRAHAQSLGFPVVADKIYGEDEMLYLEFIEKGWTPFLKKTLLLKRQALHAESIEIELYGEQRKFVAELPEELSALCQEIYTDKIGLGRGSN